MTIFFTSKMQNLLSFKNKVVSAESLFGDFLRETVVHRREVISPIFDQVIGEWNGPKQTQNSVNLLCYGKGPLAFIQHEIHGTIYNSVEREIRPYILVVVPVMEETVAEIDDLRTKIFVGIGKLHGLCNEKERSLVPEIFGDAFLPFGKGQVYGVFLELEKGIPLTVYKEMRGEIGERQNERRERVWDEKQVKALRSLIDLFRDKVVDLENVSLSDFMISEDGEKITLAKLDCYWTNPEQELGKPDDLNRQKMYPDTRFVFASVLFWMLTGEEMRNTGNVKKNMRSAKQYIINKRRMSVGKARSLLVTTLLDMLDE